MTPEEHEIDAATNSDAGATALLHAVAAPFACLLAPGRAAERLLAVGNGTYAIAYFIWTFALASVLFGMGTWQAYARLIGLDVPLAWRSFAGWSLGLTLLTATLAVLGLAWLWWPWVHREGSLAESYWRTVRVVGGLLGPAAVWAALLRFGILLESRGHFSPRLWGLDPDIVRGWAMLVSVLAVLLWVRGAALALACRTPAPAISPRCEGCGYDLTHRPEHGRCPECGLELTESLTAGRRRPGSPWSRTGSVHSWARTTLGVLLRPARFYRALRLRTDQTAERGFTTWTYLAIWLAAIVWGSGVFLLANGIVGASPPPGVVSEIILGMATVMAFGTLACWFGHRVGAAIVATWCFARRSVPDGRWLAKICTYEVVFLWVYCAMWGVLLATAATVAAARGGARLLAAQWYLGMPLMFWLWLGGTVALSCVWLWRYWIAWRAVRWNNF